MAKKKLLPPARKTQASRKRKQTPPKKKGQLVKSKGKPGPLAPAAPLAFARTDAEIENFLNYLFGCSETSNYKFHSSRQSKIGHMMGQFREILEAWITCKAEILCSDWVIKVRNNQRQRPFRWTIDLSRGIRLKKGGCQMVELITFGVAFGLIFLLLLFIAPIKLFSIHSELVKHRELLEKQHKVLGSIHRILYQQNKVPKDAS